MLSLACMIRHELGIAYAYLTYFEIFIIISNISMGLFEILQITQGPCIYEIIVPIMHDYG